MYDGEKFKKMLSAAKSYPEDENNVLELDSGMVAKVCWIHWKSLNFTVWSGGFHGMLFIPIF